MMIAAVPVDPVSLVGLVCFVVVVLEGVALSLGTVSLSLRFQCVIVVFLLELVGFSLQILSLFPGVVSPCFPVVF